MMRVGYDIVQRDEPRLIDDITPLLSDDDPAIAYLDGHRSLMALPTLEGVFAQLAIEQDTSGVARQFLECMEA